MQERLHHISFTDALSKLGHHPGIVESLLRGKPITPISMEVDLSSFCGDQCNFCHFAHTHQRPVRTDAPPDVLNRVFMTPGVAEQILSKMTTAGVRSIVFSGGGEPTDSPFALEIMKMAKNYGFELGMYTRGANLHGDLGLFVVKEFEWIVVSLDVTNPEDHRVVKGTGQKIFQRKVENIKNLLAMQERRASISLSLLVSNDHLMLVDPYEEQHEFFGSAGQVTRLERDMIWMLALGPDEVQVRPIIDTGTYHEQRETGRMGGMAFKTDEAAWADHYSWIPRVVSILGRYGGLRGLNTSMDKFGQVYRGESGDEVCYGMVVSAGLVGTDGKVYKCINTRGVPEKVIGDLTKQSMEDIYRSPLLDRAVDGYCRVSCRGCKLNMAMRELKNSGAADLLPNPDVKHPNFI